MIAPHILISFTILSFMAAAMPGPDNIYIASQAAARGFKAGFIATLGIMTGVCVHITLASLGLSAIFAASTAAFETLRWIGVAYLCYLAFKIVTSKEEGEENLKARAGDMKRIFVQGLFTNLLNPKIILFFLALLPQFIDAKAGAIPLQTAILGFIIMGTAFIVFTAVNYALSKAGMSVKRSPRARKIQNYIFGTALGGSALALAAARR